jgi:hypothetical protein
VFASEFDEFTGAPVVDSSLKLWLDAAQTTSYPGTGTTWTDLSGNGNTGTFVNGPTYTSGSVVFDGTNDYVLANNTSLNSQFSTTSVSHFSWVYPTGAGVLVSELGQTAPNSGYHDSNIEINASGAFSFSTWHGSLTNKVVSSNLSFNTWYYVGFTYNGTNLIGYVNGVSAVTSGTISRATPGANLYYAIAHADSTNLGDGTFSNMRFGGMQIYNTALSNENVLTNYNAQKSRFGL